MTFRLCLPKYKSTNDDTYEVPIEEFLRYYPDSILVPLIVQGDREIELVQETITPDVVRYLICLLKVPVSQPPTRLNAVLRQASAYLGIPPLDFITRDGLWADEFLMRPEAILPNLKYRQVSLEQLRQVGYFEFAVQYGSTNRNSFLDWWLSPGIGEAKSGELKSSVLALSRANDFRRATQIMDQFGTTIDSVSVVNEMNDLYRAYNFQNHRLHPNEYPHWPLSSPVEHHIRFMMTHLQPEEQRDVRKRLRSVISSPESLLSFRALLYEFTP